MKNLICILLLAAAAHAVDIYVSPSGSGTACIKTSPCTVTQGRSNFPSGGSGTVHFSSGTYAPFDWTKSGSSSRIVLQCDAGIVSAFAAVGQCKVRGGGSGIAVEANNIDVVGFDIGGAPGTSEGANMGAATNAISNGGTTGNSVHIIGNYVHNLGAAVSNSLGIVGCPENGAIHFQSGVSDPQALRNLVIHFGLGYPGAAGCNHAQGIYTSGSPTSKFQNNILADLTVGGLVTGASCGAVMTNNVILKTKDPIIFGNHDNSSACPGGVAGDNTVANNYLDGRNVAVFNVSGTADCTGGHPTTFSHNISTGAVADYSPARAGCDTTTPATWIHQSVSSFFVNPTFAIDGDYHLKSGSFGIAGGAAGAFVPTTDFAGATMSSPPSVGAYNQGGGVGVVPGPPTSPSAVVN